MSVSQNMNQFGQTPLKGNIAAIVNPTTLSAQIDPNSSSTLVAGDAVRLTNTTGNTILVDALSAATQWVYGFIIYNPKKDSFTAGDAVELALSGSVIYLESSGAIARGTMVEPHPTDSRVLQWAGANPVCGLALDKASASGQLIRVQVRDADTEDISSSSSCRSSSSSCRSSSSSSSSSAG